MRNIKKTFILILFIFALCSVCNAEEVSKKYDVGSGYVLARNWAWGYQEKYYYLSGQFHFTHDIPSYAAFDWVDVELDEEIEYCEQGLQTTTSLDTLFHMTELELVDANETRINFIYEKNNPTFPFADVNFTVTFAGDDLLLTGRFSDDCYDGWQYDLYAIATPMHYSGGTGEPNNPYLIATPDDLNSIGLDPNDWDKHFKMIADINMAGITGDQFNIIGSSYPEVFAGVFDGNGHCILNFTYETNTGNNIGLFGYTYGLDCEIMNLSFENPNVSALTSDNVGVLVGYNYARISDCSVTGSVIQARNCVGGLVGISQRDLYRCHGNALVIGDLYVGGLIGQFVFASIYDSYSQGTCRGDNYVGGLAGFVNGPEMSNCYSVAVVDGNSVVGSLVGQSDGIEYHECFFNELVNPDVNAVGGWAGPEPVITGKTTAEMQMRSTFADAGWDMVNVWDIGENQTYPFLRTHLPSDINKDDETNFYDLAILAKHWLSQ